MGGIFDGGVASRVSESGIVPHYPYSGRPIYAFFILLVHISVKTCKSSNFILPSVFLIWFYIDRIKTTGFAGVRGSREGKLFFTETFVVTKNVYGPVYETHCTTLGGIFDGGVASTPLGLSRVSESGIVPH